ncbi:MAG: hypothetical protein ABEJ76_07470 [Halanaeroarchaeum sp.]
MSTNSTLKAVRPVASVVQLWVWILLALSALALVRLWAARKSARREEGADSPAEWRPPRESLVDVASGDEEAASDGVVCPSCGTTNGADFTYCRECAAPLPQ